MFIIAEENLVKLFGRIWEGEGPFICAELEYLHKTYGHLTVWIHSPGGSVFDGNLISNCIKSLKADTHNAGLAASMGAILLFSGVKVTSVSNGFGMVHAPSGCICGQAKDMESGAKLMRSMEGNFIKNLIKRTGKPESEVTGWMDGDNWFDADEMLELGLIDGITDEDTEFEDIDIEAFKDPLIAAEAFTLWDQPATTTKPSGSWELGLVAALSDRPQQQTKSINPHNEMKLNANSIKTLGLVATASEAEVEAAIVALSAKAEEAVELKKKLEAVQDKAAEDLVAHGVSTGRILGAEKEAWLADAKANFDLAKRSLERIPAKANLPEGKAASAQTAADDASGDIPAERKDWTAADWKKNDWTGFLALKESNPTLYDAIRARK